MNKSNQDTLLNTFDSNETRQPLNEKWQAKRNLADEIRKLTQLLVTTTCNTETLNAAADILGKQSAILEKSPTLSGRTAFEKAEDNEFITTSSLSYELSPLEGKANPIAAPMTIWFDKNKSEAYAEVNMGWQYEGPPYSVHGGFVAALFDQFLGVAQKMTGQLGYTGTLKVRYIKPTPLNTDLMFKGRVKSIQGRKSLLEAELMAGNQQTASCEALFIIPKATNQGK